MAGTEDRGRDAIRTSAPRDTRRVSLWCEEQSGPPTGAPSEHHAAKDPQPTAEQAGVVGVEGSRLPFPHASSSDPHLLVDCMEVFPR